MLCTSNCLMLRTELRRCQLCACGKAIVLQLRAAALQLPLPPALARGAMEMPQLRLGPAKLNGLVMQLWLAMMGFQPLPGFGQELLEHCLDPLEQLGGRRLQLRP